MPIMATPAQSGSGGKELEPVGLKEVGKEVELPPEVASTGVKVQPTTVKIPPKVSQMGVTPMGQAASTSSRNIPLTDDQIAQGLTQSITSSWKWLALWCIRKLKQLRLWKTS